MSITRSATKRAQVKLDDYENQGELKSKPLAQIQKGKEKRTVKTETATDARSSKKRRGSPEQAENPQSKVAKTNKHDDEFVAINRAPVLQLWSSVVAQFLKPQLSWETCLSIGGAISTLCAVSKGRAIGIVQPKDTSEEGEANRKSKRQEDEAGSESIEVMGFNLRLKEGVVVLSGKPKPVKETSLKHKYGEEMYEPVKSAMSDALQTWRNDKEKLSNKAFSMYESFRPDISSGRSGWGRKGLLKLARIKSVVAK